MHVIDLSEGEQVNVDFGNFQLGQITLHKFQDVNADGEFAWSIEGQLPGQSGLGGWELVVLKDGQPYATRVTGPNGWATLKNLDKGTYTISETQQPGWVQSYPVPDTHVIEIDESGEVHSPVRFGNWTHAEIHGLKYEDDNYNGQRDKGEKPLKNVTIKLLDADGNVIDETKTNDDGEYWFLDVVPGSYGVKEKVKNGWMMTEPDGIYRVTLSSGEVVRLDFGNFKLGQAVIHKFEDINNNGEWDDGEPALEGWEIELWSGDRKIKTKTTNSNGKVKFGSRKPGRYFVKEVQQRGWMQTRPDAPGYRFTIDESGEVYREAFGNFQLGVLNVFKFEDMDADGSFDIPGEKGIEGWTMYLNYRGQLISAVTNEHGIATFRNLKPGVYFLTEKERGGWIKTHPDFRGYKIVVTESGQVMKRMFGNYEYAKINVRKLEDVNGNGRIEQRETRSGLEGWDITINPLLMPGRTRTLTTGPDGWVSFRGLMPGFYVVRETMQENWIQTFPRNRRGAHIVEITHSGQVEVRRFANYQYGEINGYKWEDLNGNGEWENFENPIEGWVIKLRDKNGNVIERTRTDASGYYEFDELLFGHYQVHEKHPDGWIQTYPDFRRYQVDIQSGKIESDLNFGNFELGNISGYKWNDYNGDGIWQRNDEPVLEGWTINLFTMPGPIDTPESNVQPANHILPSWSTVTDKNGYYEFTDLPFGFYLHSHLKCTT